MKKKLLLLMLPIFLMGWHVNAQILSEGFEGAGIPTGWTQEFESGTEDWTYTDENDDGTVTPRTGAQMAHFQVSSFAGETTKLVTPSLDLTSLTTPQLTFYFANAPWGSDVTELRIYYKSEIGDPWTQVGDSYTTAHAAWTEVEIILPNPSADYYIAFEGKAAYARGVNLDDIVVDEGPTCVKPTNFLTTTVTGSTADITWTAGATESAWNISWGTPGYTPGDTDEIDDDNLTANSYEITGLTVDTYYDVYVQADCGNGDESVWAGPFSVFTGYCSVSTSSGDYLNSVTSNGALTDITYTATSQPAGSYSSQTAQSFISHEGQTFNVVTNYTGGGNGVNIWIDWGDDMSFDPTDLVASLANSAAIKTHSITVPAGTLPGVYRMRVRGLYGSTASPSACGQETWGSTVDFNLTIIAPDAPSIAQAAGTPNCIDGTELTASGTLGTDETWYWQTTATGTDTGNDASAPWTVFENGTYYVRTFDSDNGIWSVANSIEVTNVPAEIAPTSITAGQNPACAPGTQITVGTAPTGVEYYWQGTSGISSLTTDNASTPYDVTETGTYYVKAFNPNTECWSEAISITVTVGTIIPFDPVVDPSAYNYCDGITSAEISGSASYTGDETSLNASSGGTFSCNGNGGGIMFNITNDQSVAITISALDILLAADVNPTAKVFYKSGTYAGYEGNEFAWTLLGEYATTGAPSTLQYIDVDDFVIPAGETFGMYVNYKAKFTQLTSTQTWSDGNLTITSGNALCTPWAGVNPLFAFNGTVHYLEPVSTDITWYDALTGGNVVGSTNPLETVGTTVMPTPTSGSYDFYAASSFDGCESANRSLVTVNINPVNVEFAIIDATCNNGDDGSFTVATVECGTAPFTYAIDGGSFGPTPTNLTAGEHIVVVKDDNGDESGEYTITIGSASGPSDVVIDDFTNETITVSWTANGSETSWNIEWGAPGFVPGTGAELGSAVAGASPYTITGLDGYTDYYVYVSADCGGSTTPEEWDYALITTDCDVRPAIGFCEDFEVGSNLYCWRSVDNNNDGTDWSIYINNANSGLLAAGIETDENAGNNDDYYILPQMNLTGNEVLSFFYNTGGSATNYRIVMSTNGRDPADFTTVVFADTVSNTSYKDTMVNLSAYTGDVYLAFHIPPGAMDGSILLIDDVCIDVCIPVPGTDGSIDVCRLDETVDLSNVITSDYADGNWVFSADQNLVSGSSINVSALSSGSHEVFYIKQGACAADTTVATINVFGKSSSGTGNSITVCKNEPIDLYSALSGNVDMGGDWYDNNNVLLPNSRPIAPSLGAQYNYQYITSNNVCPADTAIVEVVVDGNCDYLTIVEEMFTEISVYPNPATDQLNIVNPSNTSSLKVEMLDMNGRVVLVENKALNNASEATIVIDHLERGIYTLRVYNDEGQRTFKVVKQ